jgi:hypothetical protein
VHGLQQPLPTNSAATPTPEMDTAPYQYTNPVLLKAARQIYRTYYEVHPDEMQRPIGIAISRKTQRGKLIFGEKPVLLPSESFIPLNQIEPGLH